MMTIVWLILFIWQTILQPLLIAERKRKVMRKDLSWLYHFRVFLIF